MVDGVDVDRLAVVAQLVAGAALFGVHILLALSKGVSMSVARMCIRGKTYRRRVPAGNGVGGAQVHGRDIALRLPAVARDEAVLAVRAGHRGQGAGVIVVSRVVGNYRGQVSIT